MKINLNQVLVDLAGDSLKDRVAKRDENGVVKDENDKPIMELVEVTLNRLAANALLFPRKDESTGKPEVGDIVAKKYTLAVKCYTAEEINLTPEEVVLIKECIALSYPPIVVGQSWAILDQKESN